ncbi:hypothetical protein [Parvicella tangerina]|uniref:hypothetical protein n=1 Tax=Parvicella tangerina TaxID=2829795 RepID=UPI00215C04E2|nr:hypothetical protein [Parvicella tangerina]
MTNDLEYERQFNTLYYGILLFISSCYYMRIRLIQYTPPLNPSRSGVTGDPKEELHKPSPKQPVILTPIPKLRNGGRDQSDN